MVNEITTYMVAMRVPVGSGQWGEKGGRCSWEMVVVDSCRCLDGTIQNALRRRLVDAVCVVPAQVM